MCMRFMWEKTAAVKFGDNVKGSVWGKDECMGETTHTRKLSRNFTGAP